MADPGETLHPELIEELQQLLRVILDRDRPAPAAQLRVAVPEAVEGDAPDCFRQGSKEGLPGPGRAGDPVGEQHRSLAIARPLEHTYAAERQLDETLVQARAHSAKISVQRR